MASTIKQQKNELRRYIKSILSQLSEQNVVEQSRLVTAKIRQLPAYQKARSISIFLSMPGREISTHAIVVDALRQGKKVFIPYIYPEPGVPKSKIMDMLRLNDEHDLATLQPDSWGIPSLSSEGIGDRENVLGGRGLAQNRSSDQEPCLDLVFMPATAFDAWNNRLGHGKGFYDRYLSRVQDQIRGKQPAIKFPVLIGLALREQLLPLDKTVPTDDNDWRVDELVVAEAEEDKTI